ncbi:caldesmon-like [Ambystoma mexicanum]|uniref:caldesmon-like n=1 Tax=Ambystoma mexicanum TaxID=8296 RepID=UPI0037E8F25C
MDLGDQRRDSSAETPGTHRVGPLATSVVENGQEGGGGVDAVEIIKHAPSGESSRAPPSTAHQGELTLGQIQVVAAIHAEAEDSTDDKDNQIDMEEVLTASEGSKTTNSKKRQRQLVKITTKRNKGGKHLNKNRTTTNEKNPMTNYFTSRSNTKGINRHHMELSDMEILDALNECLPPFKLRRLDCKKSGKPGTKDVLPLEEKEGSWNQLEERESEEPATLKTLLHPTALQEIETLNGDLHLQINTKTTEEREKPDNLRAREQEKPKYQQERESLFEKPGTGEKEETLGGTQTGMDKINKTLREIDTTLVSNLEKGDTSESDNITSTNPLLEPDPIVNDETIRERHLSKTEENTHSVDQPTPSKAPTPVQAQMKKHGQNHHQNQWGHEPLSPRPDTTEHRSRLLDTVAPSQNLGGNKTTIIIDAPLRRTSTQQYSSSSAEHLNKKTDLLSIMSSVNIALAPFMKLYEAIADSLKDHTSIQAMMYSKVIFLEAYIMALEARKKNNQEENQDTSAMPNQICGKDEAHATKTKTIETQTIITIDLTESKSSTEKVTKVVQMNTRLGQSECTLNSNKPEITIEVPGDQLQGGEIVQKKKEGTKSLPKLPKTRTESVEAIFQVFKRPASHKDKVRMEENLDINIEPMNKQENSETNKTAPPKITYDFLENDELMNLSQYVSEDSTSDSSPKKTSKSLYSQLAGKSNKADNKAEVNSQWTEQRQKQKLVKTRSRDKNEIKVTETVRQKILKQMMDTKKERERARSRTPDQRSGRTLKKVDHYSRARQEAREGERSNLTQQVDFQYRQDEQESESKNLRGYTPTSKDMKYKHDKRGKNEKNITTSSRGYGELSPQHRDRTKWPNPKPRKWDQAKWQIKITQVEENEDKVTLNRNSVLKLFKYIRNLKYIKSEDLLVVEPSHRNTKARTYLHIASTKLKNTLLENKRELENMGYDLRVYQVTQTKQKHDNNDRKRKESPDKNLNKQSNSNLQTKKSYTSFEVKEKTEEMKKREGQKSLKLKENIQYGRNRTEDKRLSHSDMEISSRKQERKQEDPRNIHRARETATRREQNQEQQQKKTESEPSQKCAPMKGIWSWLPKALTEKKQK